MLQVVLNESDTYLLSTTYFFFISVFCLCCVHQYFFQQNTEINHKASCCILVYLTKLCIAFIHNYLYSHLICSKGSSIKQTRVKSKKLLDSELTVAIPYLGTYIDASTFLNFSSTMEKKLFLKLYLNYCIPIGQDFVRYFLLKPYFEDRKYENWKRQKDTTSEIFPTHCVMGLLRFLVWRSKVRSCIKKKFSVVVIVTQHLFCAGSKVHRPFNVHLDF